MNKKRSTLWNYIIIVQKARDIKKIPDISRDNELMKMHYMQRRKDKNLCNFSAAIIDT